MADPMADTIRLKKLKWLCRRGMKELDILLQRFLAAHEQQLAEGAWPEFEEFLQSEDDRMWACLQHPGQVDAGRYRELVRDIRYGKTGTH